MYLKLAQYWKSTILLYIFLKMILWVKGGRHPTLPGPYPPPTLGHCYLPHLALSLSPCGSLGSSLKTTGLCDPPTTHW